MLIHLLTGVFGQKMWALKISTLIPFSSNISSMHPLIDQFFGLELGTVVVYFYAVLLLSVSIFITLKTAFDSNNKWKSCCEFLSFVLLVIMELNWSKMEMYNGYNGIILVNFGIVASLMVSKMIICSVTHVIY